MRKVVRDDNFIEQIPVSEVIGYRKLYACYISFRTELNDLFELYKLEDKFYFVSETNPNDRMYKSETIDECVTSAINDNKIVLFFDDYMDYLKNR